MIIRKILYINHDYKKRDIHHFYLKKIKSMKTIFIKIIVIHLILIPFYWIVKNEIGLIPHEQLDTLLLFVWLIVIAPITSAFSYSYHIATTRWSILSWHINTALSILVIWMLFIILDVLLLFMVWNIITFRISLILFRATVIFYDISDWFLIKKST